MPDQLIYIHIYTLCGYFATIIELLFLNKLISNMKILKVNAMDFLSFCNILSLRYLYVIFRRVSSLLTTPLSKYIPKVKGKQIFFSQIFRFFCERLRHGDIYLGATHRICSVPWGNAVRRLDMHCDAEIGSATQRSAMQRHDKQRSLADMTNFRKKFKEKSYKLW